MLSRFSRSSRHPVEIYQFHHVQHCLGLCYFNHEKLSIPLNLRFYYELSSTRYGVVGTKCLRFELPTVSRKDKQNPPRWNVAQPIRKKILQQKHDVLTPLGWESAVGTVTRRICSTSLVCRVQTT